MFPSLEHTMSVWKLSKLPHVFLKSYHFLFLYSSVWLDTMHWFGETYTSFLVVVFNLSDVFIDAVCTMSLSEFSTHAFCPSYLKVTSNEFFKVISYFPLL